MKRLERALRTVREESWVNADSEGVKPEEAEMIVEEGHVS